jgi:hypothetical protein
VKERFRLALNSLIFIIDNSAHGAAQEFSAPEKLGYELGERRTPPQRH